MTKKNAEIPSWFLLRVITSGEFFSFRLGISLELLERQQGSEQFECGVRGGGGVGQCLLWAALDSAVWCYYRWRWWRWRQRVAQRAVNDDFCRLAEPRRCSPAVFDSIYTASASPPAAASFERCQSESTRQMSCSCSCSLVCCRLSRLCQVQARVRSVCVCVCVWECECRSLLCCLGIAIDNNSR